MQCRLDGWTTKFLVLTTGLTLGLNACGDNSDQSQIGGYITSELATMITNSVVSNGLVSHDMNDRESTPDIRATGVLHQAGVSDLPTPRMEGLDSACSTYSESVPPQQLAGEISLIFSGADFHQAIERVDCASLSIPSRESQENDPQQYVVLAATWVELPGITPKDLPEDQVRIAMQEISPTQGRKPWTHWKCKIISNAIDKQDLCDALPPLTPITEISSTEDLMDLRAQLELGIETDSELATSATEIPIQDALDAEQVLQISKHLGHESTQLNSWIKDKIGQMDEHGMVATKKQSIGTLEQTYIAARMMEDRTAEIFNDKTEESMNEIVSLATTTSQFDGLVARLMRAVILKSAGKMDETERAEVLANYAELTNSGCPANSTRYCLIASDAALQLDDTASPLRISIPQDLPDGTAGDEIVYRVLGMRWGVANVDDWTATVSLRGIDPLTDIADTARPTSLRIWAASARGPIYPELSTQQEQDVREGLQGLVACDGIEHLATANQGSPEKCSLDSTFAYYLSAAWGTK